MTNIKHGTIVTVLGVLIALSLGLALAYPLSAQLPTLEKPELCLSIVYAFVSKPVNDSSITGVWLNSSNDRRYEFLNFNYMIIVNVTNYSNMTVMATGLLAELGPKIIVDGNSTSSENRIIHDYRTKGFSGIIEVWVPYESKLIVFSGYTGQEGRFYDVLNDDIWVLGRVSGQKLDAPPNNNPVGSAYDLRQIHLQKVNGNYIYNSLFDDSQMLQVFGETARVIPRN